MDKEEEKKLVGFLKEITSMQIKDTTKISVEILGLQYILLKKGITTKDEIREANAIAKVVKCDMLREFLERRSKEKSK